MKYGNKGIVVDEDENKAEIETYNTDDYRLLQMELKLKLEYYTATKYV